MDYYRITLCDNYFFQQVGGLEIMLVMSQKNKQIMKIAVVCMVYFSVIGLVKIFSLSEKGTLYVHEAMLPWKN